MTHKPVPLVFEGNNWIGNDGLWSSLPISIGTPRQTFDVLPSTSAQFALVPNLNACVKGDPEDCWQSRGQTIANKTGFASSESQSWRATGIYELLVASNITLDNDASFGEDVLAVQPNNSRQISIQNSVVAGFASSDFWIGVLGLDPSSNNFTTINSDTKPSFMKMLKDEGRIPSLSFAYTAGAAYRPSKPAAHLVLGGYDDSKWLKSSESSLEFEFGPVFDRPLEVTLQTVLGSNTLKGDIAMIHEEVDALIDSTLPYIWLPRKACDLFEESFGLQYDEDTDLYTVNSTMHSKLSTLKPHVTFRLGQNSTSSQTINVDLPYAAFDLQQGWPIYEEPTNYFPIRRAHNSSQYVIGRTFLQEAYLVADYERRTFKLGQNAFDSASPSKVEAIPAYRRPDNDTDNTPVYFPPPSSQPPTQARASKLALPIPAIVGISIGGTFALTMALSVLWYIRRSRKRRQQNDMLPNPKGSVYGHPWEADSKSIAAEFPSPDGETGVKWSEVEGDEVLRRELYCEEKRHEMEVSPLTPVRAISGIFEMSGQEQSRNDSLTVSLDEPPEPPPKQEHPQRPSLAMIKGWGRPSTNMEGGWI